MIAECPHPDEKRYYDWRRTDGFSCGKCGRWIHVCGHGNYGECPRCNEVQEA